MVQQPNWFKEISISGSILTLDSRLTFNKDVLYNGNSLKNCKIMTLEKCVKINSYLLGFYNFLPVFSGQAKQSQSSQKTTLNLRFGS